MQINYVPQNSEIAWFPWQLISGFQKNGGVSAEILISQ